MLSALAKKKEKLNALLRDVEAGKTKLDASVNAEGVCTLPAADVAEINSKAREALAMQEEVDNLSLVDRLAEKSRQGREVQNTRTPGDAGEGERKGRRVRLTVGQAAFGSKHYKEFIARGKPKQDSILADSLRGSMHKGFVLLTPEEAKDYDAEDTPLSIPGVEVLDGPMRDPEIVRFEEARRPSLRDLVNVSPTSSSSIEYVRIKAVNRGAAIVAPTAKKPYMNLELEKKSTNVKTLAVLHKVTEQQLEDVLQLINIVDTEMRADLRLLEEEQMLWGSGDGDNFSGLFTDQDVPAFERGVEGDTLIDTIRRMRTDIVRRRLSPSGVLVHPLDWEAVELEKGEDSRYVWAVIQTALGPRIWSMPVVESESAENPETGARIIVVADWARGATLWDRHDIRVAVGYVDDDFARNLRTMRAENRLAFAVKRPHAFVTHETAGEESP
jgi:hypothetical protein